MKDISNRNFGLLIAHILPGFIALCGLRPVSPTVQMWMNTAADYAQPATVGGFMYSTLASLALGMMIGAVRWFIIDWLHHQTGLARPRWDDSKLQRNLQAFDLVVEHHYRYYQCYANSIFSLLIVYGGHRWDTGYANISMIPEALTVAALVILWSASRNSLSRYYSRALSFMDAPKEPHP